MSIETVDSLEDLEALPLNQEFVAGICYIFRTYNIDDFSSIVYDENAITFFWTEGLKTFYFGFDIDGTVEYLKSDKGISEYEHGLSFNIHLLLDGLEWFRPIESGTIYNHNKMKFVKKDWGWERWIINNDKYCGKELFVEKGKNLSLHYHIFKDEVIYLQNGYAEFITKNGEDVVIQSMQSGDAVHIVPKTQHQIVAYSDCMFLEFSTHHKDEDSIRITRERI